MSMTTSIIPSDYVQTLVIIRDKSASQDHKNKYANKHTPRKTPETDRAVVVTGG